MSRSRLSQEERQNLELQRLMMSARDFQQALSANTFLREECDWGAEYDLAEMRKLQCFETTMVVAYSRPFSKVRGLSTPFRFKLLRNFDLTADERELHEKLIQQRNKLHAHSDGDFTQMRLEIWRTDVGNGHTFDYLRPQGGEALNFSEDELWKLYQFLWRLRHHVGETLQAHVSLVKDVPFIQIGNQTAKGRSK